MHADEIHIDTDLVRRLVSTQFPDWSALPIFSVPSSGTDNALFRLGDALVARLPRTPGVAKHVQQESVWPPRLAPRLPVAIPAPLAFGTPMDDFPFPWSVFPWLDGVNPVVGAASPLLASDVAAFIAALQGVDPTGGPHGSRGGPLARRDAHTRRAIDESRDLLDADKATAAWEEALLAPAWDRPPVWIHADLSPGNLLVRDGRLSAVIDFGGVCVGDPACDLIIAWNLFAEAERDILRRTLGVDDATWTRGQGWALSIALIQLPYYVVTNPALAANARHVIGTILGQRAVK